MSSIKKIVYVTHARLPTEKAHGIATIKLCEAFARQGVSVELVIPRLWSAPSEIFKKYFWASKRSRKAGSRSKDIISNETDEFLTGFHKEKDILSQYHVSHTFEIKRLFCIDFACIKVLEGFTYPLRFFSFSKWAAFFLWMRYRGRKDIIFFSHDTIPLYFLGLVFKNIFYDIHDFPPNNFIGSRVMKKAAGFSVQTRAKISLLEKTFGTHPEKIVYWPNGTEIEKFNTATPQEEARKKLSLPLKEKIAVYTGQLFDWKGVDTLVRASAFLKEVKIFIVGGGEKDIEKMKRDVSEAKNVNVIFIGNRPHDEIPLWLRAADALVLPNTAKKEISRLLTSPMKLFEYMASRVPIVASRIPSVEEVVGEEDVFFAEADNPRSFASVIQEVFTNGEEAEKRVSRALEKVKKYTWQARSQKILEHIQKIIAAG